MTYDLLIIGAGQAGLTMGYYLRDAKLSYLLLDQDDSVGDSWRKRYDSLKLFTPRAYSKLPGFAFSGDQEECPTKDETANYLEHYANNFHLPLALNTKVEKIEKIGEHFVVTCKNKTYQTKSVVVATGAFQNPFVPEISNGLSAQVVQVHSAKYHDPSDIPEGTTLVVGTGNSGVQIASELAKRGTVLLSSGHSPLILPAKVGGKSIFWWMDKVGIWKLFLTTSHHTMIGSYFLQLQSKIVIGTEVKNLLQKEKILLKPRVTACAENRVTFVDSTTAKVDSVIWATGFKQDFGWIGVAEVVSNDGNPVHTRGITKIPGFYFLGLPDFYSGGSSHIAGVKYDAKFLAEHILHDDSTV